MLIHLLGHLLELFGLCAALGHMEQLFGMAFRSWKPGCSRRTIVRIFSLITVKKRPRPAKISEEKQVRAWEFWRKFATYSYTDTPNYYICQPAVRIRSPRSEDRTIVLDGTRLDLTLGYCYLCQLTKPNNSSASCPDPVRICWETRTFFTNGW